MKKNDRYGWWTVIEEVLGEGRPKALCRCDCGKEQILIQNNLTHGLSTKCKACAYKTRGPNIAKRIGGTHLAAKDKFSDYKVKAKQRGVEWNLSFEEFLSIVKQDCYYCGEAPSNVNRLPKKDWAEDFVYSGIDRYNNDIGYEAGNVLPCCKYCNYMKRELSYEDFCSRIHRIASRNPEGSTVVILDTPVAYYTSEALTKR